MRRFKTTGDWSLVCAPGFNFLGAVWRHGAQISLTCSSCCDSVSTWPTDVRSGDCESVVWAQDVVSGVLLSGCLSVSPPPDDCISLSPQYHSSAGAIISYNYHQQGSLLTSDSPDPNLVLVSSSISLTRPARHLRQCQTGGRTMPIVVSLPLICGFYTPPLIWFNENFPLLSQFSQKHNHGKFITFNKKFSAFYFLALMA